MSSSSTTSVCSGNAPTLNFTATLGGSIPTASVIFGWQVISVTGAVLGTTVGNTGIGNLSEVTNTRCNRVSNLSGNANGNSSS